MKKFLILVMCLSVLAIAFSGCATKPIQKVSSNQLTVGTVQKEIRKGMTGSEVASTLGSPNIVTTDQNGNEVWIYDKISTERAYTSESGYATLILLGYQGSSGSSSTNQSTLTIIIKFDSDKKVSSFAYHSTKF